MQSPGMYTLSLSATLFSTLLSLFIASRSTPQSLLVPLTPSGLVIGAHETISATKLYLPLIVGPAPARVLIAAAHIDSAISHEPDEALLLWNVGGLTQISGRMANRHRLTQGDRAVNRHSVACARRSAVVHRRSICLSPFVGGGSRLRMGRIDRCGRRASGWRHIVSQQRRRHPLARRDGPYPGHASLR